MITHVYTIRALTNLHVGSGEGSDTVDNAIQKDAATGFPTIYMSGIKGAIREFFESRDAESSLIRKIFGSAVTDVKLDRGKVEFIAADLLAYPVPNTGTTPNGKAASLSCQPNEVDVWREKVGLFGAGTIRLDDSNWEQLALTEYRRVMTDLPVVARNYLDNGVSKNLWYEEYLPRETVFGTIIRGPETEMTALHDVINGHVIQIGANATVGYGYCLFEKIN